MPNLYLTQDKIGTPTGGGAVTFHEYRALESLGEKTYPFDSNIVPVSHDPFKSDENYQSLMRANSSGLVGRLAHVYAGCFTKTVGELQTRGFKVSYTAAAHDIAESRKEFDDQGIGGHFPQHLIEPGLWAQYVSGYKAADLVICPSELSQRCMESYGCTNVTVIPHGCDLPAKTSPFPKRFTVGYLGQAGPDKGLRYLFEAWKKLNLKDGLLLIAGNNIEQALPLWRKYGGGNVQFMGFVKSVSELYDRVSVYVQPSVTEGFGIEVLEAMAHGKPVIVSEGAGAADVLKVDDSLSDCYLSPRDVSGLAERIDGWRQCTKETLEERGRVFRVTAENYSWDKVEKMYAAAWKQLLGI